jgi:hypothetical protein
MPRNLSGVYSLPAGSIVVDGVDDIQASQHNTPLQDIASDMNTARPIVAGGTGAATAADARANLDLGAVNSFYATTGGTVNAITLTTPESIPTLAANMQVTFNPSGTNTGATTINLNGLGAASVVTPAGDALPSGYLIARTTVIWNGSVWVVSNRPPNSGSNANGSWTRYADGTQICRHTVTTSSGQVTWTYPNSFNASPIIGATPVSSGDQRSATRGSIGSGSVVIYGWTTIGGAWDGPIDVTAIGRWY